MTGLGQVASPRLTAHCWLSSGVGRARETKRLLNVPRGSIRLHCFGVDHEVRPCDRQYTVSVHAVELVELNLAHSRRVDVPLVWLQSGSERRAFALYARLQRGAQLDEKCAAALNLEQSRSALREVSVAWVIDGPDKGEYDARNQCVGGSLAEQQVPYAINDRTEAWRPPAEKGGYGIGRQVVVEEAVAEPLREYVAYG